MVVLGGGRFLMSEVPLYGLSTCGLFLESLSSPLCGYRGTSLIRITQLKAQGPSRTCDESKEKEEDPRGLLARVPRERCQ